jgi:RecA-family ATPase
MKDFNEAYVAGVDIRKLADSAQVWTPKNSAASAASATTGQSGVKSGWRAHAITAADLLAVEFPPVNCVVPDLIPEGVCILAGRPKVGKSWLALEVCLGVSCGENVLGKIVPVTGDVLYCALEDTNRRLQRRIEKLLWPPRGRWPERLTLATQWRRLDDGGADDIADWVASVSGPRLVVLDTLAGVRPERQQRDTTYDGDYKALLGVHRFANERGFAVLVLHHTRKMEAEDPLDTISGTLGTIGCADTGLVLAKGAQGASLYVRGRDVEEREHAVSFSKETCRWAILGEASEVRRSDTRNKILSTLADADELASPEDIMRATGLKRSSIDPQLHKMVKSGEVVAISRGRYAHPLKAHKYAKC